MEKAGDTDADNKRKVAIVGGSGFVGSALGIALVRRGYRIHVVGRNSEAIRGLLPYPCQVFSYTSDGKVPVAAVQGCQAVINLAGASVADRYWTTQVKRQLRSSRINTTRAVVQAMRAAEEPRASVLIQASAIGWYDGPFSQQRDESSAAAATFMGSLCSDWEAAALESPSDVRVVIPRIGLVMGLSGGAFPRLAQLYAGGGGAKLGHGQQWMNAVHIDDLVEFISQAIQHSALEGCYNLVAPENTTNGQMHTIFASAFPSLDFAKAPAWVLRILMGEAAQMLLDTPAIKPKRLLEHGFSFQFPSLLAMVNELQSRRADHAASFLFQRQWVPASTGEVWDFFSSENNLERITPPFLSFKVIGKSTQHIQEGTEIDYSLKLRGLPLRWRSRIEQWQQGQGFIDRQLQGPYRLWHHQHGFEALGTGTLVTDLVDFRLPLFPLSSVALPWVNRDLAHIFHYRKTAIRSVWEGSNIAH